MYVHVYSTRWCGHIRTSAVQPFDATSSRYLHDQGVAIITEKAETKALVRQLGPGERQR